MGTFKRRQAGAGNKVYLRAYRFFERKRIAEGQPKSKGRLFNEEVIKGENGGKGFALKHDDGKRWVITGW